MAGWLVLAWDSAWRAGVLSFASPKERSQRKGDPKVGAGRCPVPCATRQAGRFARTRLRLRHGKPKSPGPPALLSAFHGGRKAEWLNLYHQDDLLRSTGEKAQKKPSLSWSRTPLGPLRGAEQRRSAGGFRLALFEPQASLGRRPAFRVAQGTGVGGTDPGVAFSLATFFWPPKESTPARKAEPPAN